MSYTCSECGEINPNNRRYCIACGASLKGGPSARVMATFTRVNQLANDSNTYLICSKCETENTSNKRYCLNCGASLNNARRVKKAASSEYLARHNRPSSSENVTATNAANVLAIVAIAFGNIGLCIFGLPFGLVALICGIIALTMGSKTGIAGIILGIVDIVGAILIVGTLIDF